MARGSTRRWRVLRAAVLRDEPLCQIRLPGCTGVSTTADHIIPVVQRPDLEYERANLQGACWPCNRAKYKRTMAELGIYTQAEPEAASFFD